MNILMMTNTFTPHVGGVAKSVAHFTDEYRRLGHRVVVVAPEFENMPEDEADVIRIPAIQKFNGSDFSVILPIPGYVRSHLEHFRPDIVHSHHPFLLGSMALRVASQYDIPLVFTHHTMYEQYTHYVPGDSPQLKRFVVKLTTGYCNLCDHVIAPSESVASLIRERGVTTPITSVPTGIDVERFAEGDGAAFRERKRIPRDAFVVGHLGRLAPEKNLDFLARAVSKFLQEKPDAHFVVAGKGPSEKNIQRIFETAGAQDRLYMVGVVKDQELIDAYHAMDVFAFASKSETQGMVLTEAMAAGVPVVALDASGAREVLRDGENGRLLMQESEENFARALVELYEQDPAQREAFKISARETANHFSMRRCAERILAIYEKLYQLEELNRPIDESIWQVALEQIKTEWELWSNVANAAAATFQKHKGEPEP